MFKKERFSNNWTNDGTSNFGFKKHKEILPTYILLYEEIVNKPKESVVNQNNQAKEHMDMLNHNRESQQNQNPQN